MLEYALYCGVVAFVYAGILVQPGEALSFIPRFVQFMTDQQWIHKITFHCSKCIAGQIAFWFYLVKFKFNLVTCIVLISLSILIAAFLDKIWQKI